MIKLALLSAALLLTWSPPVAAQSDTFDLKQWPVEWGGRTRDPAVAPDGKVWFVGQAGNYIANLDPQSGAQKQYEIEAGTNPHTLIVDQQGIVWYAGNRNGRIGRLDPVHLGVLGAHPLDLARVVAERGDHVARHQQQPLHRIQHGRDSLAQPRHRVEARVDDQQGDRQQREERESDVGGRALLEERRRTAVHTTRW